MSPHIYINFFWKSHSVQFSKPMGPHIQGHFALWHLQAGAGQEGGYPMGWPGENWVQVEIPGLTELFGFGSGDFAMSTETWIVLDSKPHILTF